MGAYVAIAPVFDSQTGRTHMPGHVFAMDDARAKALVPGFAEPTSTEPEPVKAPEPEGTPREEDIPDMSALYEAMTNAQLADIAKSRGLEPPKKATKAQLLDLLAGR